MFDSFDVWSISADLSFSSDSWSMFSQFWADVSGSQIFPIVLMFDQCFPDAWPVSVCFALRFFRLLVNCWSTSGRFHVWQASLADVGLTLFDVIPNICSCVFFSLYRISLHV